MPLMAINRPITEMIVITETTKEILAASILLSSESFNLGKYRVRSIKDRNPMALTHRKMPSLSAVT
tara:strand:- start:919 stop:1116 length:198 start_codon:yes stop_codon:yes gene_type:complete